MKLLAALFAGYWIGKNGLPTLAQLQAGAKTVQPIASSVVTAAAPLAQSTVSSIAATAPMSGDIVLPQTNY